MRVSGVPIVVYCVLRVMFLGDAVMPVLSCFPVIMFEFMFLVHCYVHPCQLFPHVSRLALITSCVYLSPLFSMFPCQVVCLHPHSITS